MSKTVDSSQGGPQPDPSGSPGSAASDKAREAGQKAAEAAQKASQEAKRLAGHAWKESQPFRRWAWLNLRVWMPFLATPAFRDCQVSYGGRENRDGTKWNVSLPKQCWQCSKKDGLRSREYEVDTRTFEAPVAILACAIGLFLFFILLFAFWPKLMIFLMAIVSLAGGAVVAYVKSWPERVLLVQWTCNDHADAMRQPEIVVYENELHLILATPELAEAASAELAARRRAGGKFGPTSSDPTVDPMTRAEPPAQEKSQGYKREGLPPIKLDD